VSLILLGILVSRRYSRLQNRLPLFINGFLYCVATFIFDFLGTYAVPIPTVKCAIRRDVPMSARMRRCLRGQRKAAATMAMAGLCLASVRANRPHALGLASAAVD
jgi:hypothetical protein